MENGTKKIKLSKGRLLISEPFLHDPYFKRAVVLITEHNTDGSVGFILNKPAGMRLNDALPDFPKFDTNVFVGGPVQSDCLYYIHTMGDRVANSIEITDGIFWGGNFEALRIMVEKKQVQLNEIRFFMGYSGWAPEQLKVELNRKSWLIMPTNRNEVMCAYPEDLWTKTIKSAGKDYAVLANFPEHPSLN